MKLLLNTKQWRVNSICLSKVNSVKELQNLYNNLKGLLDVKKGKSNI